MSVTDFIAQCFSSEVEPEVDEKGIPLPRESKGNKKKFVKISSTDTYEDWGESYRTRPGKTAYPETVEGVQKSVLYAISSGFPEIRQSGYGHSWSRQGPGNRAFHIAMLSKEERTSFPAKYPKLKDALKSDLRKIVNTNRTVTEGDVTYHIFDMGPSVTNHQLREYMDKIFYKGGKAFCLPVAVVMTENTLAGMVSNGCHGAGWQHKTVADYVEEITFVNPLGKLQTITRKDKEWRSAFVSYGMLGPIVNLKMRLVEMPAVNLSLEKIPVGQQIPPPRDYKMPENMRQFIKLPDEKTKAVAMAAFLKRVYKTRHYEEFVFPGQTDGYAVSYTEDGERKQAKKFPPTIDADLNAAGEVAAQLMTNSLAFKALSEKSQEALISDFAQFALYATKKKPFVTSKIDAIHFRGDHVQDFKASDYEFEIGIPKLNPNSQAIEDNLNLEIVMELYWAQLEVYYKYSADKKHPQLLPLELRVNGGSDLTLSAQRGNAATCAIEILSLEESKLPVDQWHEYVQETIDRWKAIADKYQVPFFPHLAKQYEGRTVVHNGRRMDMLEYVREMFAPRVEEFYRDCLSIAMKGGYTLRDMEIYKNDFLRQIFPLTPELEAKLLKEVEDKRREAAANAKVVRVWRDPSQPNVPALLYPAAPTRMGNTSLHAKLGASPSAVRSKPQVTVPDFQSRTVQAERDLDSPTYVRFWNDPTKTDVPALSAASSGMKMSRRA